MIPGRELQVEVVAAECVPFAACIGQRTFSAPSACRPRSSAVRPSKGRAANGQVPLAGFGGVGASWAGRGSLPAGKRGLEAGNASADAVAGCPWAPNARSNRRPTLYRPQSGSPPPGPGFPPAYPVPAPAPVANPTAAESRSGPFRTAAWPNRSTAPRHGRFLRATRPLLLV